MVWQKLFNFFFLSESFESFNPLDVKLMVCTLVNSFLTFCSFLHRHQIVRQYKSFNKVDAGGKWLEIKDVREVSMSLYLWHFHFHYMYSNSKKGKGGSKWWPRVRGENSVQSFTEKELVAGFLVLLQMK